MSESLNVDVRELPPVRVALLEHHGEGLAGGYSESIGMLFREVEGWLALQGYDTEPLRRLGVPFVEGDTMQRYWCCIEAPKGLAAGDGPVQVRDLDGGRYAVLSMPKDSATIGDTIGRFYADYAPSHGLILDETRPAIEVYYRETMDYCAPVQ